MSKIPGGGIAATALVVPLVLLCCAGPAVVVSLVSGLIAWLGGVGPAVIAAAAICGGLATYGLHRRRTMRIDGNEKP